MFDPTRIERLRRGDADEDDRDGARYLIDELESATIRGAGAPTGSHGSRYRALIVALKETTERLGIRFRPQHDSLGGLVKAHPELANGPSLLRANVARGQFEHVLEVLDTPWDRQLLEPVDQPTTGWELVDSDVDELRRNAAGAATGHDRGAVGRLCREVLVAVAEAAFDLDRHGPLPEPEEGAGGGTVTARLEAVIAREAEGSTKAELRAVLRKTLALANTVQHRSSAGDAEAMICADATILLAAAFRRLVQGGDGGDGA